MSEPEPVHTFTTRGDGVVLTLHRYVDEKTGSPQTGGPPVLLLHGASGNYRTFLTPDGGLARALAAHGFDPWLLNWRGSGMVVEDAANEKALRLRSGIFNFNDAAEFDVPEAIAAIREKTGAGKISAVGFCMGSGILAEAVALGHVQDAVDRIVLMTLGLFYETPIDGRLKCEDRLLERLAQTKMKSGPFLAVDPGMTHVNEALLERSPWPDDLRNLYQSWPGALKSHAEDDPRLAPDVNHMCNRLSFMYGMPYHHGNLVDCIHGNGTAKGLLPTLFGGIPLQMYIHGAKNIRRGQAIFTARDKKGPIVSDTARERFRTLSKVTLITGALNRLWHRDSIDLMYEWLLRGSSGHLDRFSKHVLPNYGHQDLLWGRNSQDVFDLVSAGLGAASQSAASPSLQSLSSQGMPNAVAATSPRR